MIANYPAHAYLVLVGECLANKGVTEYFSVDFIATFNQETNDWSLFALEINLRQGGTTHPMMTMKALTNGSYSLNEANFISNSNKQKFYVASDNVCGENLKSLMPIDVIEHFANHDSHYKSASEKGAVFHLLSSLSKYGKVGITCIGDSLEEAENIYKNTVDSLHQLACTM